MNGVFNLTSNTIHAILVKDTYAPVALETARDGYKTLQDLLPYEAAGTGYTSSGKALASKNVWQDDYADLSRFDSTDVTWSTSTVTASGAALLKLGTLANGSDSPVIAFYTFGGNKSSSAGDFTLQVHASGWQEIAQNC
jgi:hypothetical protein